MAIVILKEGQRQGETTDDPVGPTRALFAVWHGRGENIASFMSHDTPPRSEPSDR